MKASGQQHHLGVRDRTYLSSKGIFYSLYILLAIGLGVAVARINPIFVAGGIVGILFVLVTARYPFFGLLVYMGIYFLRLGERVGVLGTMRIELVFGAFLLAIILFHAGITRTKIKMPTDRVTIALIAYIGALVLSTFFSEWKSESYAIVVDFLKIILFYYYIVVLVNTEKRFQIVMWFIVGFTALVGIEATVAYFQGKYDFVQGIMRAEGQTTYGENYNSLSLYMASTIPLLLYLVVRYRSMVLRLISLSLVAACVLTAVITGSRSGLVAIMAGIVVYIWYSRHRLIYFALMALISIGVWTILPDQYRQRYGGMASTEIDESSQGRLDAWRDGMIMFSEKPIFGVGPGVFKSSRGERFGRWLSSHSLYVEVLSTTGFVGALTWAWFLWELFALIRRLARGRAGLLPSPDRVDILVKASYAILVGLLVAGVFGHILERDTWYLLAALLVSKQAMIMSSEEETPAGEEIPLESKA